MVLAGAELDRPPDAFNSLLVSNLQATSATFVRLWVCPWVCLCVCLSVRLSVRLSGDLSSCRLVCLQPGRFRGGWVNWPAAGSGHSGSPRTVRRPIQKLANIVTIIIKKEEQACRCSSGQNNIGDNSICLSESKSKSKTARRACDTHTHTRGAPIARRHHQTP